MIDGLLDLTWVGAMIAALIMTHITIAGVTMYLHRSQAHRSVDFHPVINHFFRFWLWITTGMVTKQWVGVHRKHHAKSDTPEDPHSPQILGLKTLMTRGAELYRTAADDSAEVDKYGRGAPDDWLENAIYTPHKDKGIFLMLAIDLLLFGIIGITVWAIQMIWIPLFAAGVINGIGHYWGYRNYENSDSATNISPWGILIGGEELHNNHHAFPGSARLSNKWWEFDIGWLYIKLLSYVGLAQVRRVAPAPRIERNAAHLDMDAVRALVNGQLNVMADYARKVTVPALRRAQDHVASVSARRELVAIRKLLNRNENLLSDTERERIAKVVRMDATLATVYQFRQRLLQLWERTMSNDKLLADLQQWCAEAEDSGIRQLQEFAERMRGYRLQPAL
ncbi:MAG: fatty acid desaturase [Gammaproteobacteria bacterium]|nr:fatty acid desaturase [Gammaproteobacteria bacterium]MCP5137990.1 fatty acid desaturase [Gammaproteobacteria bacterium]